MTSRKLKRTVGIITLASAICLSAYFTRSAWLPGPTEVQAAPESKSATPQRPKIILTLETQQSLGLNPAKIKLQSHWKYIQVPGMIVDQPGRSDRSVVTLVSGVVRSIYHVPGETAHPGDRLFTLTVSSESLHETQKEYLKAAQDIKLAESERQRLTGVAAEGKLIEIGNQIIRSEAVVKAARHELLTRGVALDDVDRVASGKFVTEIHIAVPKRSDDQKKPDFSTDATRIPPPEPPSFEIQELKVELGQQVQAGQTLCLLANHRMLAVEGRAFADETPLVERAAKQGWPIDVDFGDRREVDRETILALTGLIGQGSASRSGSLNAVALFDLGQAVGSIPPPQHFVIRHLANTMDPASRTFAFFLPLNNQSHVVERDGESQLLWRYRPGQRIRLQIPVEKLEAVFVLPAESLARDGPEAFVFTQSANTFIKTPVRVLFQDQRQVVLANEGALIEGMFVAQGAAAQLNRMVKSQANSVPVGYHVHADGSLHKNSDEGK